MEYKTTERERIHKLMNQYGTDPFTGDCYVEELDVNFDSASKTYNVRIPKSLFEKHIWLKDFLYDNLPPNRKTSNISRVYMIKPIDEEDYIVFRRV